MEGEEDTGCIKEFSKVENYIENVMKTTNPIGKFYALKSVIKLKLFLPCHSLFLENFDFLYPFQGIEFAKGICSFHYIFYIVFYHRKLFYAPCEKGWHTESAKIPQGVRMEAEARTKVEVANNVICRVSWRNTSPPQPEAQLQTQHQSGCH